ncbi:DUF2759 domain-containing protein [Bacillus sp. CGMCC 1.16541]|uniref:DUF2759 domain-containing protein n=1 Tax=Bacillus sp. CGMCC 1.16541 TaxID=2185143 RepID=UPI000D7385D8|nr:DUF2759 domain-containing protein [Bacillus sp. CGMCC 1.16541]
MGLMIIFALTTLLGIFGAVSAMRNKNFLGLGFAVLTFGIFGWFTVMTILNHGYPTAH